MQKTRLKKRPFRRRAVLLQTTRLPRKGAGEPRLRGSGQKEAFMVKSAKRLRTELDMTHGPLLGKIILFVLPLMLTNLLQVLYNAADMMVVSLSHEPNSVGAISTTGAFINLVLNVFIGFSVGANVVVARQIGAKDDDGVERAVHTSLLMSVIFGVFGSGIGIMVSRPVLELMGVAENLLDLAMTYTFIYFLGVPVLSITNYCIAILRAKGDTRTPLLVLTATGLLNVGLNFFFVLVCRMSVDGVAIATSISNAVSAVVLLIVLSRDRTACRFSVKRLRIDPRAFRAILGIGIPAGIQGALFSISNMLITSSILKVDAASCPPDAAYRPVVGGNGAAANLEGFVYTATNSVYQASITFTGQNVGAAEYRRVHRVMACCYGVTFCIAVVVGGIILLLRQPLLALYGVVPGAEGSLEAIEYNAAVTRMMIMFIPYFTLAFMEVGSGVLRGLGRSVTSTAVSLVGSCLLRIVWIYTVFRAVGTLESIYISYPLSWTLTALVHFTCCMIVIRHMIRTKTAAPAARPVG